MLSETRKKKKTKKVFGFFVGGEFEERERIIHKELGKDIDRIRFRQRGRRRRRRKKKALAGIADIYILVSCLELLR